MDAFEELGAGAGRIDLFLRFQGGLGVIVELKMLGHTYSSGYAFKGDAQIIHYMDNRDCRLGYLVLFDARIRDWGLTPDERIVVAANTIHTSFIDVRPAVK